MWGLIHWLATILQTYKFFDEVDPEYYMFADPYFWKSDVRPEFIEMRTRTFKILADDRPRNFIVPNQQAAHYISSLGGALAESKYEVLKLRYSIFGRNIYDYISYNNKLIRFLNAYRVLTVSPSNVSFVPCFGRFTPITQT